MGFIKGPLQPKIFISEHDVIRPPENESVIIFFLNESVIYVELNCFSTV